MFRVFCVIRGSFSWLGAKTIHELHELHELLKRSGEITGAITQLEFFLL